MKNLNLALVVLGLLAIFSCQKDDSTKELTLQPDAANGKDALLHSLSSTVNFGNQPQLAASAATAGSFFIVRSLVAFDLTSIPAGSEVKKAILSLYAWDQAEASLGLHKGANACWLKKVTSNWDETTVTWNTQPSTTTTNEVEIPESTSDDQNYEVDVTTLVQDMVDNPLQNYGFMLSLKTEEVYRTLNFGSSDHTNLSKRPKLIVSYKE